MGTSQSRNQLIGGANPRLIERFISAAYRGHIQDVVELLLAVPGIHVNVKSRRGATALMAAAEGGHLAIVELLLTAPGIDVNAKSRTGTTALIAAADEGHAEIVRLLLAEGANVNAKQRWGTTALMLAASGGSEGHTAIVELLLAVPGIDVNAKDDDDGITALMRAAANGQAAIVERLLAAGADVNAKDNDGETALMFAERGGHTDVVRAINSFLAAQAMNRWIPRHRDRVGLGYLHREGTPFMNDQVYRYIQQFL